MCKKTYVYDIYYKTYINKYSTKLITLNITKYILASKHNTKLITLYITKHILANIIQN